MGGKQSIPVQLEDEEEVYSLKATKTPVATGFALVLLSFLTEWIPGVAYLVGRDAGLGREFRKLKYISVKFGKAEESPTWFPFDIQTYLEAIKVSKPTPSLQSTIQMLIKCHKKNRYDSAIDFHLQYASLQISPVEIASRFIKFVQDDEALSDGFHPMIKFNVDDIMAQAVASEARYKAKSSLGPFDGLLVGIKDEIDVLNYPTDVGTNFINYCPLEDADIVKDLRSAGCIIVGKTRMHEFGLDVTGCNPKTGTARNAFNRQHWAGGSSSGSACLVGSGLCPLSIGADGGGSVRIPASYNGIYGLKPTAGRLSETGAFPLAPSVGVLGPLSSTAADLAFSYYITAGPRQSDSRSLQQPPVTIASFDKVKSLEGIKFGVFWPYFNDADKDIVAKCKESLARFESLGAEIVEIKLPGLSALKASHAVSITAEMAAGTAHLNRKLMSYPTRIALCVFDSISAKDYFIAAQIRVSSLIIF
jgi:Asp-tRNA(Asn)/Glu-tRNA(Gln) amidotransferase A subunit family amidase